MGPKPPAFQFYARDWLSSTLGLPWDVAGVYIHLLAWSWDNGPLPNDAQWRQRVIGPEEKRLWNAVKKRWKKSRNGWINPRLEHQREMQKNFSDHAKKAADFRWFEREMGAKVSINRAYAQSMPNPRSRASVEHMPGACSSSSSASSSSDQDQPVAARPVYVTPFKMYCAIARRILEAAGTDADLGELAEQFKSACAGQQIPYDGEITRKAIDAVINARKRRA